MTNLFSLQSPVSQRLYAQIGFGLMLVKYVAEAIGVFFFTGLTYTPFEFFSPLLTARERIAADAPPAMGMIWVVWTLPFLWVALTMSLRRALDAGKSPWIAMWILVPFFNFAVMIYLALLPSKEAWELEDLKQTRLDEAWAPPQTQITTQHPAKTDLAGFKAGLFGILIAAVYTLGVTALTVYAFNSYGSSLFFGTPAVAGAASGYLYNRGEQRTVAATLGQSVAMMCACMCGLLLLALEGLICIVMAAPILIPIAIVGALIGRAIALEAMRGQGKHMLREDRGLMGCLLVLPLFAAVEPHVIRPPTFDVRSTVEINAPIETVWNSVVSFPEITSPAPWYFRAGIAMPQRARIDGHGVGAIRHCEFTTGSFVEPIAVWDEPHHLAFDVTEQPEPMFELTPYRHIHPPHLQGSFRSERGEFRLSRLPNGKTRLQGRTWYTLEMYPIDYWSIWTDWIVHRIHVRVLDHIKDVAENKEQLPSHELNGV